jgi:hypothetical protein
LSPAAPSTPRPPSTHSSSSFKSDIHDSTWRGQQLHVLHPHLLPPGRAVGCVDNALQAVQKLEQDAWLHPAGPHSVTCARQVPRPQQRPHAFVVRHSRRIGSRAAYRA